MSEIRTPNSEQLKAVEHFGGVLLQAGAGSGKTFVLVEHIIFLIKTFISENNHLEETDFVFDLKKYLSGIVLMTFTNKAAGELLTRLHARLKLEIENDSDNTKLVLAQESIHSLNTGTIHSFCLKLIHQGYFLNLDPDLQIISEQELKGLVDTYITDYLNKNQDDCEVLQSIRLHKSDLVKAFSKVFGDAELRVKWEEFSPRKTLAQSADSYISDWVALQEIEWVFKTTPEEFEEVDDSATSKKWYEYLLAFNQFDSPKCLDDLKSIYEFFAGFKRLPPKPRGAGLEFSHYWDSIKKVRDIIKKDIDAFLLYDQHRDSQLFDWVAQINKVFQYVNQRYLENSKINFADFEYLVFKGLQNESTLAQVQKNFHYFIIDEFQDTSKIQFEIIRKLIAQDFNKLFCVGDIKQAIYGFRGGEISVFQECEKLVPQNLSLSNNYRSAPKIIHFNNEFFKNLFKLGIDFQNKDIHQVPVAAQTVPDIHKDQGAGEISHYSFNAASEEKFKSADVNALEAELIFAVLKARRDDFHNHCVLYKKLAPSFFLFEKLIEANQSFTCQVKLPIKEEPIIAIFQSLLEARFDKKRGIEFAEFHIQQIFRLLGVVTNNIQARIDRFYSDQKMMGAGLAFARFLFELGLSNAFFEKNLRFIETLLKVAKYDLEMTYEFLTRESAEMMSIDFQFGHQPEKLFLMTTHASKGLEFEHVLIGGIHTNGKSKPNTDFFGSLPGAMKWRPDLAKKKLIDTPYFILEKLELKLKDFSEDKRLFYVANTRAEKALSWVDLEFAEKQFSHPKGSWAKAFYSSPIVSVLKKFALTPQQVKGFNRSPGSSLMKTPFFHRNSMGIQKRSDESCVLNVLPELSVTKLAYVAECPRKFYLANILKISEDDIGKQNIDLDFDVEENEAEFEVKKSSSQRGTDIHYALSQIIERNLVVPRKYDGTKDEKIYQWVIEELKKFKSAEFISEKQIKFPVFGHMISGIPDLIINAKEYAIWDFKTGSVKSDFASYWFQLKMYAYASYILGSVDYTRSIQLALVFVDAQKVIHQEVSFKEVRDEIYEFWLKLNSVDQVNREHCPQCLYGNLCRFKD